LQPQSFTPQLHYLVCHSVNLSHSSATVLSWYATILYQVTRACRWLIFCLLSIIAHSRAHSRDKGCRRKLETARSKQRLLGVFWREFTGNFTEPTAQFESSWHFHILSSSLIIVKPSNSHTLSGNKPRRMTTTWDDFVAPRLNWSRMQ